MIGYGGGAVVKQVHVQISPEGRKETITTIHPDGSREVETHITRNKNLNKNHKRGDSIAAPMKAFNSIDEMMDKLLFGMLFGDNISDEDPHDGDDTEKTNEELNKENKRLEEFSNDDLKIETEEDSETEKINEVEKNSGEIKDSELHIKNNNINKINRKKAQNNNNDEDKTELNDIHNIKIKEKRTITGNTEEK